MGSLEAVRAMGFDEPFIRMWEYYLAISEAGFRTGLTQDLQVTLEKGRGIVRTSAPQR
jgi:cyclopropane-fatty-acyl-phospholipid synthase